MVKIYIDAGHGGSDSGAVGNGLQERDLTLDIAKRVRKYLRDNYTGHNIKMSRTTDKTVSLTQRTNEANAWGADLFLSIHINAAGGTGYEDYIFNGAVQSKTESIRNTIHTEIIKAIGNVRNRGKKRANFHVLRESRMPAVLTENLFIDNKTDAEKLKSSTFLNKVAKGHAVGVAKALGLKTNKSNKPKPSKPKPSKPKATNTSHKGKRVESKVNNLRFYNKPSWKDKDVVGRVNKGIGFPTIVRKLKVGNGYQYEVKNSKGAIYYITAANKYVRVVGKKSTSKPKPKKLRVGSKVKIKTSAKKYSRSTHDIPGKHKNKTYTIQQVGKNDVLIEELYSWVRKSDLV